MDDFIYLNSKGWGEPREWRKLAETEQGSTDKGQGEVGGLASLLHELEGEQQEKCGVPQNSEAPAHFATFGNFPNTGFAKL